MVCAVNTSPTLCSTSCSEAMRLRQQPPFLPAGPFCCAYSSGMTSADPPSCWAGGTRNSPTLAFLTRTSASAPLYLHQPADVQECTLGMLGYMQDMHAHVGRLEDDELPCCVFILQCACRAPKLVLKLTNALHSTRGTGLLLPCHAPAAAVTSLQRSAAAALVFCAGKPGRVA